MYQSVIEEVRKNVCEKLKGLDPNLTYHDLKHTLDVVKQSRRIALEEGIVNEKDLLLLEVAAFYHDTGFLQTYANHEEAGCKIFLEDSPHYHFTDKDKETVVGLIMATKIPQSPKTGLEKIICDADLDYLGRDDFFEIGDTLRKEFLHFHIVATDKEWEALQLRFLTAHQYFTNDSKKQREPLKQLHLQKLLQTEGA
jgi:hypothetical protein